MCGRCDDWDELPGSLLGSAGSIWVIGPGGRKIDNLAETSYIFVCGQETT